MKRWIFSDSQKEFVFNEVRQLKSLLRKHQQCFKCMTTQIDMLLDMLHKRQERVREARELLISMQHVLVSRAGRSELTDRVDKFIREETE